MIEFFGKCVIQANKAASWLQNPLLLAIRLYWGLSLMWSGWGKFQDIGRVVRWFDELGIPFPTESALAVSSIEFFGSMLLMIGLLARPVGAAIALVMMGAYATSDSAVLGTVTRDFFCSDGARLGDCITLAAPFPYWFAGMLIFTSGAGQFSIDAEIARWWAKANKSS